MNPAILLHGIILILDFASEYTWREPEEKKNDTFRSLTSQSCETREEKYILISFLTKLHHGL